MALVAFDISEEDEKIFMNDYSATWSQLNMISLITSADFEVLQDIDRAPKADQDAMFDDETDGPRVAAMFWNLLSVLKKRGYEAQLRYASLWLRILLLENPSRGSIFFAIEKETLRPFVDILFREIDEEFVSEIRGNVAVCCSIIVQHAPELPDNEKHLHAFSQWIIQALQMASRAERRDDAYLESVCLSLKTSLRNIQMMETLCDKVFADIMFKFLANQDNVQVQYLSGFALMLIALKESMRPCLSEHANLCKSMITLVGRTKKEKVQRIFLSVIDSLLTSGSFSEMCVMYGLYPTLERLSEENFKDEDLAELVEQLMENLRPHVRVMSSMERYEKELKTKTLEWGPVHTEMFWKRNFMSFETSNFGLVKDLVYLLESQDPQTKSVAAHDLGEFARLYPDGRKMVNHFGATVRLFALLEEEHDEEVRRHVLLATQKILVRSWQSIE